MRRLLPMLCLVGVLVLGCGRGTESAEPEPTDTASPAEAPPPPPSPEVPTAPMSWSSAGAFVWHETDVSPEMLGTEMRAAGFGWVTVFLHDGVAEDPIVDDWVERFRRASGLPVGGWGSLRSRPEQEAAVARSLVRRYDLDFYVANAEADYAYSGPDGPSEERFTRSRRFVTEFRRSLTSLPAALSSYCRADSHDLDWKAWGDAGFVFLPQAYVNDFGRDVLPAVCVNAARGHFPRDAVHPTIGMYPGVRASLGVRSYARRLAQAGTVGFSVYLAETRMTGDAWRDLGSELRSRGLAVVPPAN